MWLQIFYSNNLIIKYDKSQEYERRRRRRRRGSKKKAHEIRNVNKANNVYNYDENWFVFATHMYKEHNFVHSSVSLYWRAGVSVSAWYRNTSSSGGRKHNASERDGDKLNVTKGNLKRSNLMCLFHYSPQPSLPPTTTTSNSMHRAQNNIQIRLYEQTAEPYTPTIEKPLNMSMFVQAVYIYLVSIIY